LVLVTTLLASNACAYLYETDFLNLGQEYLRSLGRLETDDLDRQSAIQKDKCLHRYGSILNDGIVDIRIVIGYFDWTTGSQVNKDGINYGLSPSIDLGGYNALERIITGRCPGGAAFCGFKQSPESPYHFSKRVIIHGKPYQAKVQIYFTSITEYLNSNLGRRSSDQVTRSQAAQAQFTNALQNADAVFYFGHSRNGGGPDFNPPKFVSGTNRVNYNGYYKPNRPGLKKMLAALQGGRRQPAILGLMSCDSRDHFLSSVRRVAPNTGVISSKDVLQVDGVYTALIGGSDAILRGQCQSGFMNSIRRTSFNQRYITMDRVFE
jgi:hypothetical protein